MTEISKREKQWDWACRILITIDLIVILAGYISYFQTKQQLVSPLIPRYTVYQILDETNDALMKSSLIASIFFFIGLLFYSFKRKVYAMILFCLTIISFEFVNIFVSR